MAAKKEKEAYSAAFSEKEINGISFFKSYFAILGKRITHGSKCGVGDGFITGFNQI